MGAAQLHECFNTIPFKNRWEHRMCAVVVTELIEWNDLRGQCKSLKWAKLKFCCQFVRKIINY